MNQRYQLPLLSALAALPLACNTTAHRQNEVSPALLAQVSESEQEELAALRAERAECENNLRFAQNEVDLAISQKRVAEEERKLAAQAIDVAEARAKSEALSDDTQVDADTEDDLQRARNHEIWATTQVEYHDVRIDLAKARLESARLEGELVDARIDLREAELVDVVDDASIEIDLPSRRQAVAKAEDALALQAIEVAAWEERAGVYEARLEEQRSGWRDDDESTRDDDDEENDLDDDRQP